MSWRKRLTSSSAWSDVAHNFRGGWKMLWKETHEASVGPTMASLQPDSELIAILGRWTGSQVVVRLIAAASDDLVAVFTGRLREPSHEAHPALFWPVESPQPPTAERLGVYLHPDSYEGARVHEGDFVVEFTQAGVLTNIRRLDQRCP